MMVLQWFSAQSTSNYMHTLARRQSNSELSIMWIGIWEFLSHRECIFHFITNFSIGLNCKLWFWYSNKTIALSCLMEKEIICNTLLHNCRTIMRRIMLWITKMKFHQKKVVVVEFKSWHSYNIPLTERYFRE